MKNIVFFASGGGSSVENMLRFFIKESQIYLATNNDDIYGMEKHNNNQI